MSHGTVSLTAPVLIGGFSVGRLAGGTSGGMELEDLSSEEEPMPNEDVEGRKWTRN